MAGRASSPIESTLARLGEIFVIEPSLTGILVVIMLSGLTVFGAYKFIKKNMRFAAMALVIYMVNVPINLASLGGLFHGWFNNFQDAAFYSSALMGALEIGRFFKTNSHQPANRKRKAIEPIRSRTADMVAIGTLAALSLQEILSKYPTTRHIIESVYKEISGIAVLTYDPYDLVAYALGAAAFIIFHHVVFKNKSKPGNRGGFNQSWRGLGSAKGDRNRRGASSPTGLRLTFMRILSGVLVPLALLAFLALPACDGPSPRVSLPPVSEEVTLANTIVAWEESQQNAATGLVASYDRVEGTINENQAATYDQALAVKSFIQTGKITAARKTMDFFVGAWDAKGFAIYYDVMTGQIGNVATIHVGPNAWLAMAAIDLYEVTLDGRYLNLAADIARWIAAGVPHENGGVAMGPVNDGVAWPEIFSTEHNIDYAALLKQLSAHTSRLTNIGFNPDTELAGAERWIAARYNPATGILDRGVAFGIEDKTKALDTTTFLIMAYGPEGVRKTFGIDPRTLVAKTEEDFKVVVFFDGL